MINDWLLLIQIRDEVIDQSDEVIDQSDEVACRRQNP